MNGNHGGHEIPLPEASNAEELGSYLEVYESAPCLTRHGSTDLCIVTVEYDLVTDLEHEECPRIVLLELPHLYKR